MITTALHLKHILFTCNYIITCSSTCTSIQNVRVPKHQAIFRVHTMTHAHCHEWPLEAGNASAQYIVSRTLPGN